MKPTTCLRAIEELRQQGWRVERLVLDSGAVEELLGVEAAHQAEAAQQDAPESDLEVGKVDGVPVISTYAVTPYFVVWRRPVADAQGMMPVSPDRMNRRYFDAAGDVLRWLTVDPVGTIMEGCSFEGWRPTWIRLPVAFREFAREEPGVEVSVGGPGRHMVFEGNAEKVRVVMFDDDGLSAAWLATMPVGSGPLDEVLGQVRDHVGWTQHRNLSVDYKMHHGIEGWVSLVVCDDCRWTVELSELVGVAAGRWDLIEGEEGLMDVIERLSKGPVYERPSVWGRLGEEDES